MVEIGSGTLIGIGVSIFFFLLGLITKFLYDIATSLKTIGRETSTRLDNIERSIDSVDGRLQEILQTLSRLEGMRTDGRGTSSSEGGDGSSAAEGDVSLSDAESNNTTSVEEPDETLNLFGKTGTRPLEIGGKRFDISWGYDDSTETGIIRVKPQDDEAELLEQLDETLDDTFETGYEEGHLYIRFKIDSESNIEEVLRRVEERIHVLIN